MTPLTRSHRAILAIGLGTLSMGNAIVFAVLGPAGREIGIGDAQVGLIHSAAAATAIVAAPWWGRRADRLGRRAAFTVAVLGSAAMAALLAVALGAGLAGALAVTTVFVLLLAARILYGFLGSGALPAAVGLLAARTRPADRARAMALPATGFALGSIAGGLVVLPAVTLAGPGAPLLAVAAMGLAAAWFARHLPPAPAMAPDGPPGARARLFGPRHAAVLGAACLAHGAASMLQALAPFYLLDHLGHDTPQAIRLSALFGLLATLATLCTLALARRWPGAPAGRLATGALISAAGLLCLAGNPALLRLGLAHVLVGLGFGLIAPALQAVLSLAVPAARQSEAAGLLSAATTAGYILGPSLGVALYAAAPVLAFAGGAAMLVPLTLVACLARLMPTGLSPSARLQPRE